MSDDNFYGVACGMSSANLTSWLRFHATHKPDASNPSWEDLMFAAAQRIEAAEARADIDQSAYEELLRESKRQAQRIEELDAERDAIADGMNHTATIAHALEDGAIADNWAWIFEDILKEMNETLANRARSNKGGRVMIDLLTLTAALLLQPAAHEALDTGPQPRALRWTMQAAYRPEADDIIYREKWSAEEQRLENRAYLRPGRGITSTYWNTPPLYLVPPAYPIYGLCCGYSDEDDPPQGYVPETPEPPAVPLPASVWMLLAGLGLLTILRVSRR